MSQSQKVVVLDGALPTHFQARHKTGSLAAARAGVQSSFAVVGTSGKVWKIKYRGEETLIRDARGQPLQELDVVIVGAAPSISKIWYNKGYSQGDDAAPDCFSLDGIEPDAASPVKQNGVCATCPQNQWGSQVTAAGKKAKACRDHRRVAVVPLGDIANETYGGPMLLRLAPTSLVPFSQYSDYLERKGVGDFSWVGTKLTFDYEVTYPKVSFSAISYVTEEQDAEIAEVLKNPLIERILNSGPIESAPAQAAVADDIPGKPPARGTVTPLRVAPPQEVVEDEEDEEEAAPAPAAKAAPATPFQASTKGKRKVSTQTMPTQAPNSLEGAIDDLLDDASA